MVGNSQTAAGIEAFIWNNVSGMRLLEDVLVTDFGLDLTGWTLTTAQGMSADGLVYSGFGTNPNGQTEAWIASVRPTAVPEPSTLSLFAFGLAGLRFVGRRRRRH